MAVRPPSPAAATDTVPEPADRPYGVEAVFRDDSGNRFNLTQSKWLGG